MGELAKACTGISVTLSLKQQPPKARMVGLIVREDTLDPVVRHDGKTEGVVHLCLKHDGKTAYVVHGASQDPLFYQHVGGTGARNP
eukprot:11312119-Karenia_brevis.AAC.1